MKTHGSGHADGRCQQRKNSRERYQAHSKAIVHLVYTHTKFSNEEVINLIGVSQFFFGFFYNKADTY